MFIKHQGLKGRLPIIHLQVAKKVLKNVFFSHSICPKVYKNSLKISHIFTLLTFVSVRHPPSINSRHPFPPCPKKQVCCQLSPSRWSSCFVTLTSVLPRPRGPGRSGLVCQVTGGKKLLKKKIRLVGKDLFGPPFKAANL